MTSPKPDEKGMLSAPRFVSKVPGREAGSPRIEALKALAPAIQARPKTWAAVMESPTRHGPANLVTAIRRGAIGNPDNWETACRKIKSDLNVLFIRYVGK